MAKSKLTADIPGIGQIEVSGNVATEDSIQDLIAVMTSQTRIRSRDIEEFNDNIEDAANNVDEFSDSVEKAEKAQSGLTKKMAAFADKTSSSVQGLQKFADSGGTLTSFVDAVGEVAVGISRGIGGMVPFIGDGLEELTGALGTAAVGLVSTAVGMTESFIGLNKQIFNAGLQIQGGFDTFVLAANDASLPMNEFANAMLMSSDRLRLFASGAPGGIVQVSKALKEFHDNGIMENLYSLGFTTEEVVAGMTDYAIAAERQGRSLSAAELAAGSEQYLKNLRELSRLTGVSVKEAQAQIEADRSNLFIQRQLMQVSEGQRADAAAFAGYLEELGYGPMRDFIIAGQSMSRESAIMSSQMPIAAGIMRDAYNQIANGTMTNEQATAYLRDQLRARSGEVDGELRRVVNTFGVTPQLASDFGTLGTAVRTTQELMGAANSKLGEASGQILPDTIQENLGKFEQTINNVQEELQQTFLTALQGASPLLGTLADVTNQAADAFGRLVDSLARRDLDNFLGSPSISLEDTLANAIQRALENTLGGTALGWMLGINDPKAREAVERQLQDTNTRLERLQTQIDESDSDSDPNAGWSNYGARIAREHLEQKRIALQRERDRLNGITPQETPKTQAEIDAENYGYGGVGVEGYAAGGVARGPNSGYLTELHGTEAVVPLPNGESIPVSLSMAGIRGLLDGIVESKVSNTRDTTTETEVIADISASLDNSRTLGELLQVNKSMLQYFITSMQKSEEMLRAMDEANYIARNNQYARA